MSSIKLLFDGGTLMGFFGAGGAGAFVVIALMGAGILSALILVALWLVTVKPAGASTSDRRRSAAMLCVFAGASLAVAGVIALMLVVGGS